MMRINRGKVRTGCITCKKRHVKCDEGRPECQRCVKAGRRCEGYVESGAGQPVRFVVYAPERALTELPDLDHSERRALDHFRDRTALELAGDFQSPFWVTGILPLSRHDASVKHAIIALSSMHEHFRDGSGLNDNLGYALSHYGKAMREVVRVNQHQVEYSFDYALATCALFSGLESLQGQYHAALSHATSGIRILAEEEARALQGETKKSVIPRDLLTRFFLSMDRQIMEFADPSFVPLLKNLGGMDATMPDTFESYEDALRPLELLMLDLFRFAEKYERMVHDGQTHQESFKSAFIEFQHIRDRSSKWSEAFDKMPAYDDSGGRSPALLILIVFKSLVRGLMERIITDSEASYDNFLPEIWTALGAAEELLRDHTPSSTLYAGKIQQHDPRPRFSMSLGIVAPLFLMASQVADVEVRDKAVALLTACNRREGLWDSKLAAHLAERIIVLRDAALAENPASQLRVHDMTFLPGRQATLRFAVVGPPGDAGRAPEISEEFIEAIEWESWERLPQP